MGIIGMEEGIGDIIIMSMSIAAMGDIDGMPSPSSDIIIMVAIGIIIWRITAAALESATSSSTSALEDERDREKEVKRRKNGIAASHDEGNRQAVSNVRRRREEKRTGLDDVNVIMLICVRVLSRNSCWLGCG